MNDNIPSFTTVLNLVKNATTKISTPAVSQATQTKQRQKYQTK